MNLKSQKELEEHICEISREKINNLIYDNEEKGLAYVNPYAQTIFRRFVKPLAERIKKDLSEKKAGRNKAHVRYLKDLNPYVIAYISVRKMLTNLISKGFDFDKTRTKKIIIEIANSIYNEQLLKVFNDAEPELFFKIKNDIKSDMTKDERRIVNIFKNRAKKYDVDFEEWTRSAKTQVGSYILNQLEDLDFIEIKSYKHYKSGKNKTYYFITLTEECFKLIESIKYFVVETTPYSLPCIEKPKDWTSISNGGYHTKKMRRMLPFAVKSNDIVHLKDIDLSQDLKCMNILQSTQYKINRPLLKAMKEISNNFDTKEILSSTDVVKPKKPHFLGSKEVSQMTENEVQEFKQWKYQMSNFYTEDIRRKTKWGRFYNSVNIAEQFELYPNIYFTYFCDFRGRKYANSVGVNPQGSDMERALLEFSKGEILDTENSINWFKIEGSNRFGNDKQSFKDRIQWVDDNHYLIMDIANNYIDNREWLNADNQLMFLAWCFEYRDWFNDKKNFLSKCICGVDGSCNGLQHYSAMFKDKVGAVSTNLIDQDKPADIYTTVAEETQRLIEQDKEDKYELKDKVLEHGINRKMVKRSVMTLPYGSTRFSCTSFIREDYFKQGLAPEFDKQEYHKVSIYISNFVWQAIKNTVFKAREAMDCFQQCAGEIIDNGYETINWTLPTGFKVIQRYNGYSSIQARTMLYGKAILKINILNDKPSRKNHKNGIAPNFIHSLDACHLTLTTNSLYDKGVKNISMVHDEYCCHAKNMDLMNETLRENFVYMYNKKPLEDFINRYDFIDFYVEEGNFDLNNIYKSTYFFC